MAKEVTTQHTVSTTQPAVAPATTEQTTTTTTTTAQPAAPADQTVNVNAPITDEGGGVTINVPATPGVTTTTTATPQVNINKG